MAINSQKPKTSVVKRKVNKIVKRVRAALFDNTANPGTIKLKNNILIKNHCFQTQHMSDKLAILQYITYN